MKFDTIYIIINDIKNKLIFIRNHHKENSYEKQTKRYKYYAILL